MYLAKVYITLNPTVNDPQGKTIRGGLQLLGFETVTSVRAGKYLELKVDESNKQDAEAKLTDMCQKLLANPVIEDYRFELENASDSSGS
jgi:phosphoribosylformylglycinamidine synthase